MHAAGDEGIVARGVRLERGGRTVLGGVDLDVPRGAVTALVAPSGAGKSSLLRCCVRLLEPSAGRIALGGTDVGDLDPRALRRRVGLVAQSPVMLPGTVEQNVRYAVEDPSADVPGALERAGLDAAFGDRDAQELSGGERARVALARALVRRPEVLLLDEPTAALDADVAATVGATLRELAARGFGVCLAVHDLAFAARFEDRRVGIAVAGAIAGTGDGPSATHPVPDGPAT